MDHVCCKTFALVSVQAVVQLLCLQEKDTFGRCIFYYAIEVLNRNRWYLIFIFLGILSYGAPRIFSVLHLLPRHDMPYQYRIFFKGILIQQRPCETQSNRLLYKWYNPSGFHLFLKVFVFCSWYGGAEMHSSAASGASLLANYLFNYSPWFFYMVFFCLLQLVSRYASFC